MMHVTKWGFGRIGPPFQSASLFGFSVNPPKYDQDWVKVDGLHLHVMLVTPAWLSRAPLGKVVNIGNVYGPIHTVCIGKIVWEMIN